MADPSENPLRPNNVWRFTPPLTTDPRFRTYDESEEWHDAYEAAGHDENELAALEEAEDGEQRIQSRYPHDGILAESVPILTYEMPKVRSRTGDAWPTLQVPTVPETGWPPVPDSMFLNLPAELRNLVYDFYFNENFLLDEPELAAQPPDSDEEPDEWVPVTRGRTADCDRQPKRHASVPATEDITRWTTTIDFGSENVEGLKHLVSRSLLRTSRQIRSEALPIAIEGKLWLTDNVRAFPNFLNCLGPSLWNHIAHLHIEDPWFPCCYEDPKSVFPAYDELFASRFLVSEEADHMKVPAPDDPIETITACHPIFEGSYSAAVIKTIAALPHLRTLYMTFTMAKGCRYVDLRTGNPSPDSRRERYAQDCPSFRALEEFFGKGMKRIEVPIFSWEPESGPPGYREVVDHLLTETIGPLACSSGDVGTEMDCD